MLANLVAYFSLVSIILALAIVFEFDLYHRRRKLWPTGPVPSSERSFLTNPGRFTIYLAVAHTLGV